jgi:hypothetical protein
MEKTLTDGNKPAFPSEYEGGANDFTGMPIIVHQKFWGLTKREYFAAMAMQGYAPIFNVITEMDDLAKFSVKAADALITQLNQQP